MKLADVKTDQSFSVYGQHRLNIKKEKTEEAAWLEPHFCLTLICWHSEHNFFITTGGNGEEEGGWGDMKGEYRSQSAPSDKMQHGGLHCTRLK